MTVLAMTWPTRRALASGPTAARLLTEGAGGFLPGVLLGGLPERTNTAGGARSRTCPGERLSPFECVLVECVLAGLCDPDADNFGRLGASHSLAFCGRKPDADEVGDHVAIEAMGAHKQCLGSATWANGEQIEQLQSAAGMRAQMSFSNGRHAFNIGRKLCTFN
jgi:hypothetical protein